MQTTLEVAPIKVPFPLKHNCSAKHCHVITRKAIAGSKAPAFEAWLLVIMALVNRERN